MRKAKVQKTVAPVAVEQIVVVPVVETPVVETPVVEKLATKKPATKKSETKKPTAKKPAANKSVIYVQYAGKSFDSADLMDMAKEYWTKTLGNKATAFKNVELYVKTEESRVYVVVNGEAAKSFKI